MLGKNFHVSTATVAAGTVNVMPATIRISGNISNQDESSAAVYTTKMKAVQRISREDIRTSNISKLRFRRTQ